MDCGALIFRSVEVCSYTQLANWIITINIMQLSVQHTAAYTIAYLHYKFITHCIY